MNINQLEYFCYIVEEKSFTKAAKLLYVSQPALTNSIANLEKELGVQLFDRSGKTIVLTEYGTVFYNRIKNALAEVSKACAEVKKLKIRNEASVRLAGPPFSAFPNLFSALIEKCPNLVICPIPKDSETLTEMLINGTLDMCITSKDITSPGIERSELSSETFKCLINRAHPLANKKLVSKEDLIETNLAMIQYGTGIYEAIRAILKSQACNLNISYEASNYTDIFDCINTGKFATLMTEESLNRYSKNGKEDYVLLPISGINLTVERYLYSNPKRNSTMINELKDRIETYFKKQ